MVVRYLPSLKWIGQVLLEKLDWSHPFLTIPTKKIFDQLLIYVNLYKHAKNQANSLIWSGDMIDEEILQSDWLRTENMGFVEQQSKYYKFFLYNKFSKTYSHIF